MNRKRFAGGNVVAYGRSDRLDTFHARGPRFESAQTKTPQQARQNFSSLFQTGGPGPLRPPAFANAKPFPNKGGKPVGK
jgi:hypothetical protein